MKVFLTVATPLGDLDILLARMSVPTHKMRILSAIDFKD